MRQKKAVIFDLDGTLVDAYPAIIKSHNYVLHKLGYPAADSPTIRRAVGWGDENLLRPFVGKNDLKRALLIYRRHHRIALTRYTRLFPGVKRLLSCLRSKGYKIAVASNRPTEFSWIIIRRLGLKKYFNYVLCADKLKHGKPHPDILFKIIKRLGVLSSRAVYVGDMTVDAEAGRRAGVKTIIVTTGSSSKAEIKKEKPYKIIRKITELFDIL